MAIPIDTWFMWATAIFYFAASYYLIDKIKRQKTTVLYPIAGYLLGVTGFFVFFGIFAMTMSPIFALLGALSMMLGASTIARFPLQLEYPDKEKMVYYTLIVISLLITVYLYNTGDPMAMMRTANLYAFIFAGVLTIGYIVYSGLKTAKIRRQCMSTAGSLGLCCVAAHALVGFQLLPGFALSLFGIINLELPMIFAILSPIAFLYVMIIDEEIKPAKS